MILCIILYTIFKVHVYTLNVICFYDTYYLKSLHTRIIYDYNARVQYYVLFIDN